MCALANELETKLTARRDEAMRLYRERQTALHYQPPAREQTTTVRYYYRDGSYQDVHMNNNQYNACLLRGGC